MRDAYHDELDRIGDGLAELGRAVAAAMARATTALLDADLQDAELVIAGDRFIDERYHMIEAQALDLLARQQPVATDLRVLVTSLRMVADIERAGDLALHVAKVARRRYPQPAIPRALRPEIREMGYVAQRIMGKACDVVAYRDVALAHELETDDDAMDELHKRLFGVILRDDWAGDIEAVVDVTLVGRFYERFADHAVSVARRVVYLVTGERVVVL
ncbi:MAG TPA: phosphate signaling complex protein PhoU [Frankiaceae bacterium]|nr:phosphate signaling complex protein PhoU [Frankiaceae bacterium]